MKIHIERNQGNIVTIKDYKDIEGRGELAHIICELESIKADLFEIWEDYDDLEKEHDN